MTDDPFETAYEDMCPNCVTTWKCNGPHEFPEEPTLGGLRYNEGKPKLSMVMEAPNALRGCAQVLMKGEEKYARNNWKKGLPFTGVLDSMQRHVLAFQEGEDLDPETGLPHVDHILCNALFLSELFHSKKEQCDDRATS